MKRILILFLSMLLFCNTNVYALVENENNVAQENLPNQESSNNLDSNVSKGEDGLNNSENTNEMNTNNEKTEPTLNSDTDNEQGENDTSSETTDHVKDNNVYDIQKVKVVVTKIIRDGEETTPLKGSILQIINSTNNDIVDEWTSDGNEHVIELPEGKYIIHEKEAPLGYNLAEDIPFTVSINIEEINAGSDVDPYPCDHYGNGKDKGVVLYFIEIGGVKYEVYCINQNLATPDENSSYDGALLNPTDINNYTIQETYKNPQRELETKDVSDPSLSSQELYDKYLNIIYHRHLAVKEFPDLNESEIRYVTESALKNYSNTLLMERQRVKKSQAPVGYDKYNSYEEVIGATTYVWYIYPMYRSFVYLPDAPLGSPIYTTIVDGENANSFGNIARHWNDRHNASTDEEVRKQVKRYYDLYNFLISDENPHPSEMNLYIYSPNVLHYDENGENPEPYQHLLGITGYFEVFDQEEQHYEMEDTYSTETVEASIKKEWNDQNNKYETRPNEITVALNTGETITLNEENNWSGTISNLPKYNKGELINYEWEETEEKGYTLTNKSTEGTVTTITNTLETVDVTINKVWVDNNNQDGLRPTSLEVTLNNGTKVTLNEENNWTFTIKDLPAYKNGKKIEYTWSEPSIEGYTQDSIKTENNITTITNSHKVELIEISVKKEWHDNNNERKMRPDKVIITLLADGENYDKYELSESDDWTHIFKELPKYNDGKEIEYEIIEEEIANDYKVSYEGNIKEGIIIHNSLEYGDITPPPSFNPKTSDNVITYFITLFINAIVLISTSIYFIKIKSE